MQEVFEKIIEKLNSKKTYFQGFYECEGKTEQDSDLNKATQIAFDEAIEIVKQEGEKMRIEIFEKIIDKLEKERLSYFLTIANTGDKCLDVAYEKVGGAIDKAVEIFKQEAEQYTSTEHINCSSDSSTNGWIPCSERLSETNESVLCWAKSTAKGR